MIQLVADGTWHGLEDYLHAGVRKRAAISYIGPAAAELLDLVGCDMIIVSGSDAALQAGQVDPTTISLWTSRSPARSPEAEAIRMLWGQRAARPARH